MLGTNSFLYLGNHSWVNRKQINNVTRQQDSALIITSNNIENVFRPASGPIFLILPYTFELALYFPVSPLIFPIIDICPIFSTISSDS